MPRSARSSSGPSRHPGRAGDAYVLRAATDTRGGAEPGHRGGVRRCSVERPVVLFTRLLSRGQLRIATRPRRMRNAEGGAGRSRASTSPCFSNSSTTGHTPPWRSFCASGIQGESGHHRFLTCRFPRADRRPPDHGQVVHGWAERSVRPDRHRLGSADPGARARRALRLRGPGGRAARGDSIRRPCVSPRSRPSARSAPFFSFRAFSSRCASRRAGFRSRR